MKTDDVLKALEICEKLCFFGGQRAGRELWFDKPVDVQDKDIEDFVRDVTFLKDFIDYQKVTIERLYKSLNQTQCEQYTNGRNDGIREFAERLKEMHKWETEPLDEYDINSLVKEMTESIHEKTSVRYYCDICNAEIKSPRDIKYPVIFHTEQNEGRPCSPYISQERVDLCDACLDKVCVIHAFGAMGVNKYEIRCTDKETTEEKEENV